MWQNIASKALAQNAASKSSISSELTNDNGSVASSFDENKSVNTASGPSMGNFGALKAAARFKTNAKATSAAPKASLKVSPGGNSPPLGIPIRELLQQIYNYKRDQTIKDLVIYSLYVIVFVAVIYQINISSDAYSTNAEINNLFITQQFGNLSYPKTFLGINEMTDVSAWFQTVLAPNLYPTSYYNGNPLTPFQSSYIAPNLHVVEGARLRQVRVSNTSCSPLQGTKDYLSRFSIQQGACYGSVSGSMNAATSSYGPSYAPAEFKYYDSLPSYLWGLNGYGPTNGYGYGGYVVYLPSDPINGTALINQLVMDTWFDDSTRAIAIDINIYNSQTNMLSVSRFLIEILETGFFVTSYEQYTFRMLLYQTIEDYARFAGEIIIAVGCIYYLAIEIQQLAAIRPHYKYFMDASNVFDLILQGLVISVIIYWGIHVTNPIGNEFRLYSPSFPCNAVTTATPNAFGAQTCWLDMYNYARNYNNCMTIASLVALLMALKFFKFFKISRRMNTLWLTLGEASIALVAFMFGFCLLIAGFAFMGQLIFGGTVSDFHTFASSFSKLLRFPLGEFNYYQLDLAQPVWAPIFFVLYMALVFLVGINMIIAIITISYENVTNTLKLEERWKHATIAYHSMWFKRFHLYRLSLWHSCRRSCKKCCRTANPVENSAKSGTTVNSNPLHPPSTNTSSMPINTTQANTFSDVNAYGTELYALSTEENYVSLTQKLISQAESISGQDLLSYIEEIYQAMGHGKNVYLGLNELCALTRVEGEPVEQFCAQGHRTRGTVGSSVISSPAPSGCCSCSCSRRNPEAPLQPKQSSRRFSRKLDPGFSPFSVCHYMLLRCGMSKSLKQLEKTHDSENHCLAYRVMQSYAAYKDTTLLGDTQRHQFYASRMIRAGNNSSMMKDVDDVTIKGTWKVMKMNRHCVTQQRLMRIKEEKIGVFMMYCLTEAGEMKRRFPLANIVQVEASVPNPTRLFLYIETDNEVVEDSDPFAKFAILADTVYDLSFLTQASRDEFVAAIIKYREAAVKLEDGSQSLLRSIQKAASASSKGNMVAARAAQASIQTAISTMIQGEGGGNLSGGEEARDSSKLRGKKGPMPMDLRTSILALGKIAEESSSVGRGKYTADSLSSIDERSLSPPPSTYSTPLNSRNQLAEEEEGRRPISPVFSEDDPSFRRTSHGSLMPVYDRGGDEASGASVVDSEGEDDEDDPIVATGGPRLPLMLPLQRSLTRGAANKSSMRLILPTAPRNAASPHNPNRAV
jgi:Polycystin cation channel